MGQLVLHAVFIMEELNSLRVKSVINLRFVELSIINLNMQALILRQCLLMYIVLMAWGRVIVNNVYLITLFIEDIVKFGWRLIRCLLTDQSYRGYYLLDYSDCIVQDNCFIKQSQSPIVKDSMSYVLRACFVNFAYSIHC